MALCHFVVGGLLGAYGVDVPGGVNGDANILIQVTGAPAHTVIAFLYLLIIIYGLTLAPICWIYAAEVWSLGRHRKLAGMLCSFLLVYINMLTLDSLTSLSASSSLLRSATSNTGYS